MSLVVIATPRSESELSVMLCTLEAHDIPATVNGGGMGPIMPGPQIGFRSTCRLLVPEPYVAEAHEALAVFLQPEEPAPLEHVSRPGKWRQFARMLLGG